MRGPPRVLHRCLPKRCVLQNLFEQRAGTLISISIIHKLKQHEQLHMFIFNRLVHIIPIIFWYVVPLQVEVPKVSPQMQSSMRTNQSKGLKRGRKKGRKGKGKGKFTRGNSKLRVLNHIKGSETKTKRGKKTDKVKVAKAPKKPKKVAAQEEPHQPAKTRRKDGKNGGGKEPKQNRFNVAGKGWAYEVLPDQVLGCTNCRFIFNGCRNCSKKGFKGKSAAQMRLEQQEVLPGGSSGGDESWDNYVWDENLQDWVWDQSAKPTKPKVRKSSLKNSNANGGKKGTKEPKTSKGLKKDK